MKRKIISNTYLRDVTKYQMMLYLDEDDCYISVKKLIEVTKKFIIKGDYCVMDKNYYVLEIIPKNENYALRVFLDKKGKVLEYYFDITKNNGLDEKFAIPYYDDLYLDITVDARNGEINILDKDELENAYATKDITEEDYWLVMRVKEKLLDEIKSNSNKLMNLDYSKYLF